MEASGQLHAPAALPPGKEPLYPLDRRLGIGEEKNSHPLSGLKPPVIQPIAQCYTTELSWLLYKDIKGFKT
jgi:hypothetical protein